MVQGAAPTQMGQPMSPGTQMPPANPQLMQMLMQLMMQMQQRQ
jgi:hypothetical protein